MTGCTEEPRKAVPRRMVGKEDVYGKKVGEG